jgi:hypothetical protein
MGSLSRHAVIPAPPAAVYAFVANLRNAPEFITAIEQITSAPAGPPAVGQRFGARATFLGRPAPLTLRVAELAPGRRVAVALDGDPPALLTITLRPEQGGHATRVETRLDAPSVPALLLVATMGGMLDASLTRLRTAVR